ncbi:MAG: EAL domain-containing protein [Gammaproteobacteria bacterium]|nr:EAL domain-containing protein [Gammaproteobacteria bacterium]
MTKARILIVHPDTAARTLLRDLLALAGYEAVQEAGSGSDALRLLRRTPIDAIVSDIEFPELDAWRLARLVRSGVLPSAPTTPFIIVASTWCERIAETTAREFGVNALLAFDERQRLPEVLAAELARGGGLYQRSRVLVIEDYPETLNLVKRILDARFDVDLAEDGEIGLRKWREGRHELVLLDVMLPKLSGPEVLDRILAEDPAQPVVIMTANSTLELAEQMMMKGAADFVTKPFRAEELRRVCEIAARREDYLVSNRQFAEKVRHLEDSREAYRKISESHQHLLNHLRTVVLEMDAGGAIRFLNRAWAQLTGFSVDEGLHKPFAAFIAPKEESQGALRRYFQSLLAGEARDCRFELELRSRSGDPLWADCRLVLMVAEDGRKSVSGSLDNITHRKLAESEVERLRLHDSLTGLYNRVFFDARLAELAHRADTWGERHALLVIDLDHFKVINDSVGHHAGDMALQEISRLLAKRLRQDDILCRVGGDEFAVLLADSDVEQAMPIATAIAELIKAHPCRFDDQVFALGSSIGISLIDGSSATSDEYLKRADIALYVAKQRGRNRIRVYDPADRDSDELRASVDWARRLRQALDEGCLELHFQPVLHIASGQIAYYEALARLRLPERLVAPGEFIPALERAGEMPTLDFAVLDEVVAVLAANPELPRIAFNLSAQSFTDARLLPRLEDALEKSGVRPARLIVELTESDSLSDVRASQQVISRLNELGCSFSIDDFGSGFSTFAYLKELPAQSLKLDGSYVRNLASDPVDQALVQAISQVAVALGKATVAEFVEDAAVLDALRRLGIDYAQGYYIGRPQPLAQIAREFKP